VAGDVVPARPLDTSPSLPLAPTVLVQPDGRPLVPAAPAAKAPPVEAKPAEAPAEAPAPTRRPPPRQERKSGLASFIFILLVLAGALVAFSTTELPGAKEVRAFCAPVLRLVRNEAAQQLPKLREKTRQAVDNAVDMLAGAGVPAQAECPLGTRRIASASAHAQEGAGASGEHAAEPVCVDESLVSESEYDGCAVCERPRSPRARRKTDGQSQFCIDGKAPTIEPIRCVTWKQADIYCASRAARLPSEDELRAMSPTAPPAPGEWTHVKPSTGPEKGRAFRCARGP
jgi:hypothetical protein